MRDLRSTQSHGTRTQPPMFWMAAMVVFISSSMLLSAGCASKQETQTAERRQRTEHFECLPDRWAEPPKDIGQTPPDSAPSARDIDPFLETNPKIQD